MSLPPTPMSRIPCVLVVPDLTLYVYLYLYLCTVTEANPVPAQLQRRRISRPLVFADHAGLVLPPRSLAVTTTRQVSRELCRITDVVESHFRRLASRVLLPSPAHVGYFPNASSVHYH